MRERNEVAALVGDFLDEAGSERSVVSRSLPALEHVNLQAALDTWSREPGRQVVVHGIAIPPHHGTLTLQQLVAGERHLRISIASSPAHLSLGLDRIGAWCRDRRGDAPSESVRDAS